jgi:hypothetical protein
MSKCPPMRRLFLTLVAAGLALSCLPAHAVSPVTTIGSPSIPGTSKGFTLVGHTDLGARGMNSPLALAGRCAYVGDRSYVAHPRTGSGVAIVDVANPAKPTRIGTISARPDTTQRELRADASLGLLLVLDYSPYIGSALSGGDSYSGNDLQVYDISKDCAKPRLVSTYDFGARSPHEFFLWKDPKHPGRVLAYVTTTIYGPDLTVLDLTNPTAPKVVSAYTAPQQEASGTGDVAATQNPASYIHSISVSDDGTKAYVGGWDYGTYVLDTSGLADPAGVPVVRPLSVTPLDYGANVHGTVAVPGHTSAVMVQEEYANAGRSCPFGWLRMADLADPANPKLAGAFKLPENDCPKAQAANGTFTAHNQTTFPSVTLLTWYSGGLRAVDTTDPYRPVEAGFFVPKADISPAERDTRLYFPANKNDRRTGAMWSYPVVQNGLVYVVDIDLGLYILRYTGPHASEVAKAAYVEGNSAPSRYTAVSPVPHRPTAIPVGPPTLVRDSLPLGQGHRHWTWIC